MFASLSTSLFQITNPQIVDTNVQAFYGNPAGFFNRLVNYFLYWGFLIGAVVFFFMVVAGGITWITSGGDKQKVESARRWLTNGGIGLALLFFLFVFVSLINAIFDLNLMRVGSGYFRIIIDIPGNIFDNLRNITPQNALTYSIQLVLIFAVVFFFFMFVIGGIRWITSAGDKMAIEAARRTVTNALVGLLIVFSIFTILYFINRLFGVNIGGLGEAPRGGCYAGCVGNADCQDPLYCDTNQNWCYDPVACAGIPTPGPSLPPGQQTCEASGGVWELCFDTCDPNFCITPPICSPINYCCNCPGNLCWNGSSCIQEPTPTPDICTPVIAGTFTCGIDILADTSWSWGAIPGTTQYRLDIASDSNFTNILLTTTTNQISYAFNDQNPGQFYGRVRVNQSDGTCTTPGNWSASDLVVAACYPPDSCQCDQGAVVRDDCYPGDVATCTTPFDCACLAPN